MVRFVKYRRGRPLTFNAGTDLFIEDVCVSRTSGHLRRSETKGIRTGVDRFKTRSG
jgi:hypothetical protein